MNKIVLDRSINDFSDEKIDIKYDLDKLVINISGDVYINDYSNNLSMLTINVLDNSKLIYNRFNNNIINNNIKFNINNNSNVVFNQSINQSINGIYNIDINIMGNNNNYVTNIYGLTKDDGKLVIGATGNVVKDIYNNSLLENVRILMLNEEENIILPNLLVSSNEVNVEHNATISSVDENYIFYLNSKGIDRDAAINLVVDGFLNSKFID